MSLSSTALRPLPRSRASALVRAACWLGVVVVANGCSAARGGKPRPEIEDTGAEEPVVGATSPDTDTGLSTDSGTSETGGLVGHVWWGDLTLSEVTDAAALCPELRVA